MFVNSLCANICYITYDSQKYVHINTCIGEFLLLTTNHKEWWVIIISGPVQQQAHYPEHMHLPYYVSLISGVKLNNTTELVFCCLGLIGNSIRMERNEHTLDIHLMFSSQQPHSKLRGHDDYFSSKSLVNISFRPF